jgi:tetratricopeptide (TPR) repeat protein
MKYRIKIDSRVIGPLTINGIVDLFQSGKLNGKEMCQEFPDGEWKQILSHEKIIKNFNKENKDDGTVIRSFDKVSINNTELDPPKGGVENDKHLEFKYSRKSDEEVISYDELNKKYEEKKELINEEIKSNESNTDVSSEESPKTLDRTVIIKKEEIEEFERTKIIPKIENEALSIEVEETSVEDIVDDVEEVDVNDSTQAISLADLKNLQREKKESENLIVTIDENEKKDLEKLEETVTPDKKVAEKKVEKKKMTPIVLFSFIVILGFLFLEEDEKKAFEPKYVKLRAPVTLEVENSPAAKKHYDKGMKEYAKGGYLNKVKSSHHFKKSVENKIKDNPALGMLVLTYGELINNSINKKSSSRNLFNLTKITRAKTYKNTNVAIGTALFYKYAKKQQTALNVIENYLRISKPTLKLFGVYMDLAIDSGDLVQAKKIFDKVSGYPDKPIEIYLAMSKYHSLDENYEEGKKVIKEGLSKYGNSVALLLEYASYFLRDEKIKSYTKLLKRVEALSYEGSPVYFAKYLEYVALLSALNKDNEKAALLFRTALKINNSESLRGKLASLEIGGGKVSESLILESKSIDLVRKSKKLVKLKEWDKAFRTALAATNLGISYLPAELNLVRLQIKRGFYEFSINNLEKLKEKYPRSSYVKFYLLEALTKANKLSEAQKLVSYITTTQEQNINYYSVVGRYYNKAKKTILAVRYLSKSVTINPLKDEDYYLMAQIYMKSRQYKEAKSRINDAIDLDPLNIDYISTYSKIVYELDGAETAIGYLREQLKTHVDNPKLLGNIASYYYESGQVSRFEDTKKQILKLSSKDENFYKFLIEASRIEENDNAVVENAEKLLTINPGDLTTRILLSNYYARTGTYNKALLELDEVILRLSTYPRAYYYKAKVYIKMRDYKRAKKAAELEISNNPTLYNGWYIMGETYRLTGNYKAAIKNLEKSISIMPKSVEALKSLGWIKLSQRFYDIARELYLRAKKGAPNDPEIRKQLALIYRGIGQSGLAVEEYQTYLKLYPNAPDRKIILQQINALSR